MTEKKHGAAMYALIALLKFVGLALAALLAFGLVFWLLWLAIAYLPWWLVLLLGGLVVLFVLWGIMYGEAKRQGL